ncbi:MAG TPA: YggS family pyridoxal phosphate enzyme [Streptosporangiaceae bacterium]|nr:YggS family pyridoxal phosphate enzyme [Streptosporangiaceae bacterium]
MTSQAQETERREQLRRQLEAVEARIAEACAVAGRRADEVTLIAITKTFPASDVAHLAALGLADFGENRDQEAEPKAAQCAALGLDLRWHFVGQLQVNKSASVSRYADVVHSVDRSRLIRALGSHAITAGRQLTCLIQVNLDEGAEGSGGEGPGGQGGPGGQNAPRGGAFPGDVPALAAEIAAQDGLVLGGVMAIAPLDEPARPAFARLRRVAELVRSAHPGATMISAGMSGDMDDAIAEGATHVRVGTALLGGRPLFVR